MKPTEPTPPNYWKSQSIAIIRTAFLMITFGIIYSQSPLYTSNQNQYFLHGLAKAEVGYLNKDWLANTIDPTPVFSLIVSDTYRVLHTDQIFYVYYFLLIGIYFFSSLGIAGQVFDLRKPAGYLLFTVLFAVFHSAALRYFLTSSMGEQWTYVFEGGLAGQRILGSVLQPSTLGVFLLVSIYFFLKKRIYLAAGFAALAPIFHPTYLFTAMIIVLAYMWILYRENGEIRKSLYIGVIALVLVLPVLVYVFMNFGPSSSIEHNHAQEILVNFRIPHHAIVAEWFGASAILQLLIILIGMFLSRHTKLFSIFALALIASVLFTFIQIFTKSDTLALLFPWRISAILVPISFALLLAFLVEKITAKWGIFLDKHQTVLNVIGSFVIVLLMIGGLTYFISEFDFRKSSSEGMLFNFVAENKSVDEVYLVPIKMQDFRLATGAPTYVDFKSIPYQDEQLLEWYRRIQVASRVYLAKKIDCEELEALRKTEGITHLAIEKRAKEPDCLNLQELYTNDAYSLYKIIY